ncbi:hypothetical protein RHMOL_Rhmol06G0173100 [Rhododendron molle]|uniref:Uncharacterized protein n=2 Tax=Rhododendron molle TaxID=49168 RepID=A0ACC0NF84_RHOML|nr:hypothetical protein RHMOL_Rhmol06G0173100 [Rhododendron molle]KAI8551278.1 hypothetical protein RHMOL_Rhmol06G0173100 [Rhododendron molle]
MIARECGCWWSPDVVEVSTSSPVGQLEKLRGRIHGCSASASTDPVQQDLNFRIPSLMVFIVEGSMFQGIRLSCNTSPLLVLFIIYTCLDVIFAEPIVITAHEFLEQNATSASSVVTLIGYRCLTLVIYGHTAEDLGQFNIEVDLDSTLANTVSCIEGKLEDLPPALHPINVTIEDLIFMPKALSLEVPASDISVEAKPRTFKLLQLSNRGDVNDKVIILSALASLSTSGRVTNATVDKLTSARFQLKTLMERGFFPLSAALLSSISRSQMGNAVDIFVDIASYLEAVILSLLFCRSGLIFLLYHPELSTNVILALRGSDGLKKEEPLPLQYASVLISKGFVCQPEEIGMIVEKHLRMVNAIDCLLTSDAHSEEILWVLWELCALSRSHCGRQALLAVGHFLEAVSILIAALQSIKELDPDTSNSGFVPLNLAVFHSAAEIFEVIVTNLTASSLGSWIGNATELHKALNSSSPGSNRKDAPTRLL